LEGFLGPWFLLGKKDKAEIVPRIVPRSCIVFLWP